MIIGTENKSGVYLLSKLSIHKTVKQAPRT